MAISIRTSQPFPRPGIAQRRAGPSVREVCLLGVSRPGSDWSAGDRLEWDGRLYQVTATQADRAPGGPGTCYVYLTLPGADAG
jgi:hypothetical protein